MNIKLQRDEVRTHVHVRVRASRRRPSYIMYMKFGDVDIQGVPPEPVALCHIHMWSRSAGSPQSCEVHAGIAARLGRRRRYLCATRSPLGRMQSSGLLSSLYRYGCSRRTPSSVASSDSPWKRRLGHIAGKCSVYGEKVRVSHGAMRTKWSSYLHYLTLSGAENRITESEEP